MAELATIARPYAEALFQSTKAAELATCLEQLNELAQLASLPEVAALSNNPKVSADDLSKLLSGMVKTKLDGKIASFLSLVNQNHRLSAIPEIAKQFEAMKNKSEGAAEVMITSAFPLEGSALNDLLSSLKKRFGGKELRPTIQVDPALIGGVRIQVGDEVMDSSVKAQLAQMQASLGA
ncbi:F0F1 ATP synthase subunit delta [Polynucleobacter sp. Nonnen-W13]|jgi:F-type H+-transporting ATPase subunit delta|uniref:F0F1 ATP synthase subunit delta n=1 Tax=Polynucleobacter sp. Nonnen-W13 TaxID=1855625 RepID=UPI001C0DD532|nr:F0F1 ATP synthase subunit delta [Polynucleobacter sp. Nonnen-W13]MBU3558072.1 F0F1 ATP synthase subunit delta [Polynucleobacter sp. Nonnen-W13]